MKPLSASDADRFVREQIVAAGFVGLQGEAVPATRAQLSAYIAAVPALQVTAPAAQFARSMMGARMPLTMRPFWALHIAGAACLLPAKVCRDYALPRWLPPGRMSRGLISAALFAINYGYLLFGPVRRARAKLKQVEREMRSRSGAA